MTVQIRVSDETYARLELLKTERETFDTVIRRLMATSLLGHTADADLANIAWAIRDLGEIIKQTRTRG